MSAETKRMRLVLTDVEVEELIRAAENVVDDPDWTEIVMDGKLRRRSLQRAIQKLHDCLESARRAESRTVG